jgi:putative DNA primase/helicase
MEATERLARYDPAVLTHADTLDADPWLLNCQNGTLDLRTGKLRAHDPADLLTALVPTDYVPDTPCPRFEAFLAESIPDPDTRGFVQRLLGYGLTGETRERVFALGVGPTASGKSTLAAVLRGVLGSDYTRPISADALVRTHLEDLRVAGEFERGRIQIGSEVPREGQWRTALLKSVTGGTDLVACRPLYSETRQFRPGGLVLLFANHYPQADAEDGAFWERCRVVTFGETCPQERRDPSLDAALLEERVGILAWLVRGCLEWQRDGLRTSAAVADAGERYRLSEDVTGRFLEDRVIWDPSATLPAKDLYAAFVAWCEAEGESPCTQTRLGLDLAARGFEQKRTNAARIWRGLRLRADRRGPYRPDSTPTTHSATQRESIHNASGENSDGCDGCDAIPIKSLRVTRDRNDSYLENVQGFCENPSNASHPSLCLSHIATADAGSAGGRSGNHLPVAAASDAPSPVPEEYAAASVPHTVNRRGVAADEQERDIARGLRAEDEFAALLEAAGIDFERTPKHVTEPDGGADFILSSGVGVDVKTTTMPGRAVVCEEQMPHLPEWLAFCHTHGEEARFLGVIRSADFMAAAKLVGRDGSIPGPMRASGEPYRAHYPLRVLADDRLGHLRPIDALREDV